MKLKMQKRGGAIVATLAAAVAAHVLITTFYEPYSDSKEPDGSVAVSAPALPTTHSEAARVDVSKILKNSIGKVRNLDVAFCIDTTGSMAGEIDAVKANVQQMVAKLRSGQPKPTIRVGLVAYRDQGDDYVTKVFPFSSNIHNVRMDIDGLSAEGGGDGPEAVDTGLHVALNDLDWAKDKQTAKLLFLIGDAPAHDDRHDFDFAHELAYANDRGIRISTIACDGLHTYEEGIPLFKKIATLTNGNFQPLAYRQDVVDASGKEHSFVTSGGTLYALKPEAKARWTEGADALVSAGLATPALQGATCGTIGPQGSDATVITGVNTAGTVRSANNLGTVMFDRAFAAYLH